MKSKGWRQEQRDDLTLPEFANMLWGWRALVLGCALALSLAAVVFELARGTTYTAEAAVAVQPAERLDVAEEPEAFTRSVRDAVSVFAPDLTREAARKAGWRAGAGEFGERLETEIVPSTGEIRVRFSAGTPEEASSGANAYAESFALRVEDLGRRRLAGGTLAAEAQVVRVASPEMVQSRGPLLYG
ncbi:MAG: hypothetical protein ACRDTR_08450, partial [Rubrobacter sp.]